MKIIGVYRGYLVASIFMYIYVCKEVFNDNIYVKKLYKKDKC